jgi:hypothetical protein
VRIFGIDYRQRHLQFALSDIYAYLLAFEAGFLLQLAWGAEPLHFWQVIDRFTGASLFTVSSTMLMLYLFDGYQRRADYRRGYYHLRLWASVICSQLMALVAYGLFPRGWWGPELGLATGLALAVFLSVTRYLVCWPRMSPASIRSASCSASSRRPTGTRGGGRATSSRTTCPMGPRPWSPSWDPSPTSPPSPPSTRQSWSWWPTAPTSPGT